MAARLRKTHQDDVRSKIQTSNLITRVHKYAMGELSDDDISSNRLNAIKLLLNKTLPDLSTTELNVSGGLTINEIKRTIIDPK